MSEGRKRILKMLADEKITLDEADELLAAFQERPGAASAAAEADIPAGAVRTKPRFLRVQISEDGNEKVNVRVPLAVVTTGMKLGSLLPAVAREKVQEAMRAKDVPFDLNRAKPGEVATFLEELNVNFEDGGDHVRVFCE